MLELSREVLEAGKPVDIIGLCRHGQTLNHGVAVLWPTSHVQCNQVKAAFIRLHLFLQRCFEHSLIELRCSTQGRRVNAIKVINKCLGILIATLQYLSAQVGPALITRHVTVFAPILRVLLQYPVPVIANNGFEGLVRGERCTRV